MIGFELPKGDAGAIEAAQERALSWRSKLSAADEEEAEPPTSMSESTACMTPLGRLLAHNGMQKNYAGLKEEFDLVSGLNLGPI